MNSYRETEHWRNIQPYLPTDNRITVENEPEETWLALGDIQMHIDVYRPSSPTARVILLHGVGGNGRLLSFAAIPLQWAGYEALCPDLPLYGLTRYGGEADYRTWVYCVIELIRHCRETSPLPTFLFGLSAGGMLAYQAASECPEVRGVIATCLLDQRERLVRQSTASNRLVGALSSPLLSIGGRLAGGIRLQMRAVCNMNAIANDPDLVKELMRDPFSAGASVPIRFLNTYIHPEMTVEPEDFHSCPVLWLQPEQDRWTNPELTQLFFDRLACDKEYRVLQNAGHFPVELPGLRQLTEYVVEFIEKHRG